MNNLWHELKRRNVVRVAIAYAVVGWAILQFVDIVMEPMSLPEWFQRVTIVALAIGFPIALLLSWAYEVTPEGVKKTSEVDKSKSITHGTGQKINKLIIGALSLAVVFLLVDKFYLSEDQPGPMISEAQAAQTTIAVLPFINMSADPDQEFFSDGITEEILNVLAKNKSLRVAGRTSSFAYKGQNQDMRQIGEDLGVEYLVEGSVRKSGDTVRVTAQVITAKDGFHIWSDTYDRELIDIFAIQDEIARAVADALEVSFGLAEDQSLVSNTTNNMEAYDIYLQARDAHKNRHIPEAWELSQKVVEMEPEFAPGWAVYAQVLALVPNWIYFDTPFESAGAYAQAGVAAQQALILDPNSVLAWGALANVYRTRLQWSEAEEAYLRALEIDADNPVILEDYVEFLIAVGKIKEAMPFGEKLVRLEPQVPIYQNTFFNLLVASEDIDRALVVAEKTYNLAQDQEFFIFTYFDALRRTGKYDEARMVLAAAENLPADSREEMKTLLQISEKGLQSLTPDQLKLASNNLYIFPFLNNKDQLFDRLSREVRLGWWGDFYTFLPEVRAYAKTQEFKNHVKELRLVDYWQKTGWGDYCKPVGTDDFECE